MPGSEFNDPLAIFHVLVRAGVPFVSLRWLRKLKERAARHKDLDDLENLPAA